MPPSDTNLSARYVIDVNAVQPAWHRENTERFSVYKVHTVCGLSFTYPQRSTIFRHHKQSRIDSAFSDCEGCKP